MNEHRFKELMALSRLKQPFSDFEERMMLRLEHERRLKLSSERFRKVSWLFFVLGAVLGAAATSFVSMLPGLGGDMLVLGCRLIYVALLLAGLNYLLSGSRMRALKS